MARKIKPQGLCFFCEETPCTCAKPGVGSVKPNPTTDQEENDGDAERPAKAT